MAEFKYPWYLVYQHSEIDILCIYFQKYEIYIFS